MISEKIKEYRLKNNLTQKDLADKLYITPQAISRWESGDTEPSSSTLVSLAQIFGISVDELLGNTPPKPDVIVKTETVYKDAPPPVLGICRICKKPIFETNDLVEKTELIHHGRTSSHNTYYICRECSDKVEIEKHRRAVLFGRECRKKSFVWGGLIAASLLSIWLIISISQTLTTGQIIGGSIVALLFFPFISCIFLKNNFIEDMFLSVASFGFVKLPGLIFTLDLDGIIWLLTVKLLFWIIGLALSICSCLFAIVLGLMLSLFVYPFAIRKNISHPEQSEAI